jgi:hypothetical protein
MNLLYTPSKALSLMIAGKAFHKIPRMKSFGKYPANNQFEEFRVSAKEDLSEMNADSIFIYSRTTASIPRNAAALQQIAGCGNSQVVQYDGTGAYFLDKQENGVWTLEVYPDVLWLRDPFEATSLSRQAARLFWNERKVKITLPDLGENYTLLSVQAPDIKFDQTSSCEYLVKPGKYLVARKNIEKKLFRKYFNRKEKFLDGLYTPPAITPGVYVVNTSKQTAGESDPSAFRFQIAGEKTITHPTLYIKRFGWHGFAKQELINVGGFDYALADTPKILQVDNLEYCIAFESGGKTFTFPGGAQITPEKWDFSPNSVWKLKIIGKEEAITVLNVSRDIKDFVFPHFNRSRRYTVDLKNGSQSDETSLSLHINFLEESKTPFGIQLNVSENLQPFAAQLDGYKTIVLKARSSQDSASIVSLNFIMADGKCYTAAAKLKNIWQEVEIPLSAFHTGSSLILPNSYPLFLPEIWNAASDNSEKDLTLSALEFIQIVANPAAGVKETDFEIVSVTLKK